MTTQMVIRIDENLKAKAAQIAKTEGRTISEVIRTLLEKYIFERDFASAVDKLWEKARQKMESKGFSQKDVERAICEVRQNKK